MASLDHTTGSTPDKPVGAGSAGFSGGLVFFCILVGVGVFANAVHILWLLSDGLPMRTFAPALRIAFFGLGLFLTLRRHPRTRLYWLLVFGFMGFSSWGMILNAHEAGRPGSESDVSWVLWSIIWFFYWLKSKQVALNFGSRKLETVPLEGSK